MFKYHIKIEQNHIKIYLKAQKFDEDLHLLLSFSSDCKKTYCGRAIAERNERPIRGVEEEGDREDARGSRDMPETWTQLSTDLSIEQYLMVARQCSMRESVRMLERERKKRGKFRRGEEWLEKEERK